MRAGGELAVLVHIAIDQKIGEIRSDAAIVQKRVALAWRSIADDLLSSVLGVDEEGEELVLGLFGLRAEAVIELDPVIAFGELVIPDRLNFRGHTQALIFGMPHKDAEGTAMGRQLIHVEKREPMPREGRLRRDQREI